jgi:Domain of unknown function (DUF6471)
MTTDVETVASRAIRGELKRLGVTQSELVKRLAEFGVVETDDSLRGKLKRGTFSFTFALLCFKAMGSPELRVDMRDIGGPAGDGADSSPEIA